MNTPTGQSVSLWMRTAKAPEFPALSADFRADVCVVGAGIAGLSTAYLLAREGKSVVVLDDGPIGSGQTRRTTAHLSNAIDDRYVEIERVHGAEGAKLAAASHSAAIDRIASNVEDEAIDCDFTRLDGYLFCPPDEKSDLLERECDAARRAGLKRVEVVDRAPIPEFDTGPALRFPKQGMFDPMKYLAGLVKAFRRYRGEIFTGTHAAAVADGSPAKVMTANGSVVTCDAVVVATNAPVNDRVALHTKQAPYITFAIALPVPRGSVTKALYWDTPDPYHYVRLQGGDDPGEDLLIVGGEDHKTGQDGDGDAARYARLELWARRRWPQCGPPAYRWSGQVMESDDGLAFIGRNPGDEHVYTVTGDSGMGMTHGTIAGILLTDLILGRENPWATLYDPSRKHVWGMAGKEFVKENLNVAKQYLDWVTGGDVKSADQIAPGEGAVLRRGLHKVAVYRDKSGALTELSATCPHLGCVVHWNGGEKTWDCPCHGSRFDARGLVINGPANRNLAPAAGDDGAERKGAAERTTAP